MAILESNLKKSATSNSQAISEIQSVVNETGCQLKSLNTLVSSIKDKNLASIVNNKTAHEISRVKSANVSLQEDLEIFRDENFLLRDTMEALTREPKKPSVESNVGFSSPDKFNESVLKIVTINANHNTAHDFTTQTIESDRLTKLSCR